MSQTFTPSTSLSIRRRTLRIPRLRFRPPFWLWAGFYAVGGSALMVVVSR